MSSDEASSGVTYTSISNDYEEPSNAGSPGVVVYGYGRLPMHPVDPSSSNYVPDPEEPKQALPSPDYVPGPEYPKYLAPSDVEIPVEDQPHAADALPTALSSGYIADSDPEDESEDGPTDYPADGGDDDDDDSSGDDVYDEDKEEASEQDKEEDEEEHLALADSTAVSPTIYPTPSAEETEPFETDESAAIPLPPHAYRTIARISIRAQEPIPFPSEAEVARLLAISTQPPSPLTLLSSPLPQIPSPPTHTSRTYAKAPLGFKAAEIQLRAASPLPSPTSQPTHHPLPLPSSSHLLPPVDLREEVPKADLPPRKRLCLITPTPRFEVGESSTAVAARQPSLGVVLTTDYGFVDMVDDTPRRHVPREVGYGITDTWDELVDAIQEGTPITLESVNARVTKLAETHKRDTHDLYAHLEDAQDSRARLSDRVDILLEDR
ncbi:hypothetical protein Tco_0004435 [Tanacetum coccineum]